jgi:hypothetical protein
MAKPCVKLNDVLADPIIAEIDSCPACLAFLAIDMINDSKPEDFEKIVTYVTRPEFPDMLEILIVTSLCRKSPNDYLDSEAFVRWAKSTKHLWHG